MTDVNEIAEQVKYYDIFAAINSLSLIGHAENDENVISHFPRFSIFGVAIKR